MLQTLTFADVQHRVVQRSVFAMTRLARSAIRPTALSAALPHLQSVESRPQMFDETPGQSTSETSGSPEQLLHLLISEHSSAMFRVAKSIVREDGLAEDVVQESIIKAWQAAASFRGESSLKSWALRITHNTAVSMLRRRREEYREPAKLPEVEVGHGTDRQVQGHLMVAEFWDALNLLDPVSRTITVLREIEGMSYEDIADTLNLALPTIKTRLFRSRKLLANALKEWR